MIGKVEIVLSKKPERHHKPVNIVEDERVSLTVCILRSNEVDWLFAPMTEWVQMVSSVVAVVEAHPVALIDILA